jgi:hypothetical protein
LRCMVGLYTYWLLLAVQISATERRFFEASKS